VTVRFAALMGVLGVALGLLGALAPSLLAF
jgi:hypothetical protein